jgi:mono/diheme cytochrome c family protein
VNRAQLHEPVRERFHQFLRTSALAALALLSALTACSEEPLLDLRVVGGDVERGRAALARYECGVCHVIPDVPGAVGQVGPPLSSFARHVYIAGKFPNAPEVLVRFIPDAPSMAPETGMPAIAMSERDARDMAAYLYSLK